MSKAVWGFKRTLLFLGVLSVSVVANGEETLDFQTGSGFNGRGIYNGSGQAEVVDKNTLKVTVPGRGIYEGVFFDFKTEPGRNYEIRQKLKGDVKILLKVNSGNASGLCRPFFIYPDKWEEYSFRFFSDSSSCRYYVLTYYAPKPSSRQDVFFIRDMEVIPEKPRQLEAVEISPASFEAEDYVFEKTPAKLTEETGNNSEKLIFARGGRYFILAYEMPCVPQTSLPFYIYLKVRSAENNPNKLRILRKSVGKAQIWDDIYNVSASFTGKWQWVKVGPLSTEIGKTLSVSCAGPDKKAKIDLDCVVVSTDADLNASDLNKVKP